MTVGPIGATIRGLLQGPGLEAVWRFRQIFPTRSGVISALLGRYPRLRSEAANALYDLGEAAAVAAETFAVIPGSDPFDIETIPINEYFGVPGDFATRGTIEVEWSVPPGTFPEGDTFTFGLDSDLSFGDVDELRAAARGRALEICEQLAQYHPGLDCPPDLEVDITFKYTMRRV